MVVRPTLWLAAFRVLLALAPTGWWRRPPFWPRPDPEWLAFRMETAYGRRDAVPSGADLVDYLGWVRAEHGAGRAFRTRGRWAR